MINNKKAFDRCQRNPSEPHFITGRWDSTTNTCTTCGYGTCSRANQRHWGDCSKQNGKGFKKTCSTCYNPKAKPVTTPNSILIAIGQLPGGARYRQGFSQQNFTAASKVTTTDPVNSKERHQRDHWKEFVSDIWSMLKDLFYGLKKFLKHR